MQATDKDSGRAVYWGTGRRKCSVARVRLVPGTGQLTVNKKPGEVYFQFNANYLGVIKAPLETLGMENDYDILVTAEGGGLDRTIRCDSPGSGSRFVRIRPWKSSTSESRRLPHP